MWWQLNLQWTAETSSAYLNVTKNNAESLSMYKIKCVLLPRNEYFNTSIPKHNLRNNDFFQCSFNSVKYGRHDVQVAWSVLDHLWDPNYKQRNKQKQKLDNITLIIIYVTKALNYTIIRKMDLVKLVELSDY